MSFALDSDLERAKSRLGLLSDPNSRGTVRSLAERYITEPQPEGQRRSLAKLASARGADSVTLRVYLYGPTPGPGIIASPMAQTTAPPTLASQDRETPRPVGSVQVSTAQPAATPSRLDFRLFERVRLTCQQEPGPKPRIVIFVQDAAGRGLPGIRLRIQWNDGEDTFFTGLRGADPGYAEYEVQTGMTYSVAVVNGTSQVAVGLSADALDSDCANDGKEHFRTWRIIFRRPT